MKTTHCRLSRFGLVFLGMFAHCGVLAVQTNKEANKLHFERLSLERGLSQSSVPCITQDRQGFMWFGTMNGLNRFDGHRFEVYLHDPDDPNSLSNDMIFALFSDRNNNLWVGTADGLNRLSLGQNDVIGVAPQNFSRYYHNPADSNSLGHNRVSAIFQDSEGAMWFGTPVGLSRLDETSGHFIHYFWEEELHSLRQWLISDIGEMQDGNIFVVTLEGQKYCIDRPTGKLRKFNTVDPTYDEFWRKTSFSWWQVKGSHEDRSGTLWVATTEGLYRYHPESNDIEIIKHDPLDPTSLSTNSIFSIFEDGTGTLWFGTALGGVNKLIVNSKKFRTYKPEPFDASSLGRQAVYSFAEDPLGFIWVGTREGLAIFDPDASGMLEFEYSKSILADLRGRLVSAMRTSHDKLWIGTDGGGLYSVDFSGVNLTSSNSERQPQIFDDILFDEKVWAKYRAEATPQESGLNRISNLCFDSANKLWIGTFDNGIWVFDKNNSDFKHYAHDPAMPNTLGSGRVRTIHEDKSGVIWIGTDGAGLGRFNSETENFTHFTKESGNGLTFDVITSIQDDDYGYLWLGTYGGGLNRFDPKQAAFEHFNLTDGLPNNVVYGILPDAGGALWMSSNKGISRFDPRKTLFENYDMTDGLQSNEFNSGAFFKSPLTGKLYFGGIAGFNEFYPDSVKRNDYQPSVVITSMQADEQAIEPERLRQNLLELEHDKNAIAFEFVALDYSNPMKCQYAYMIEGLDERWTYCGTRRYASYFNLPPGHYKIKVKGTNSDGVWSENQAWLRLTILPPWWQTWWFRLSALIVVLAVLWAFYKIKLRRMKARETELSTLVAQRTHDLRKRSEELAAQKAHAEQDRQTIECQAQKLLQLDKLKSRFFANVSHEFRTPLTLILGPAEQMLSNGLSAAHKPGVLGIKRNALRLLTLINQLLDLSKLEAGKLELTLAPGLLNVVVDNAASSFSLLAEQEAITFTYRPLDRDCHAVFDQDKVEKVLNNLLSNAFKFTPRQGGVTLAVQRKTINDDKHTIEIRVQDTGIGINESKLAFIFDRFYKTEDPEKANQNGSGIGLALVKELVQLHGGTIHVKSRVGEGTEFIVRFALDVVKKTSTHARKNGEPNTAPGKQFADHEHQMADPGFDRQKDRHLVVVVEDNQELSAYLRQNLQTDYQIICAKDGIEGMQKINNYVPDVVISDIMMPGQDGVDLCKGIRNNELTSHIPVILLTAKASLDSRLDGLQEGADDYLTKPFHLTELRARIANLIKQRQRLQRKYMKTIRLEPEKIEVASPEEAFLKRVCEIVNEHLGCSSFGPSELACQAMITERQLRRKMNALLKKTPREFIRIMRLRRARQLLLDGFGNIAEVAYQVGFGNISYFSKCFRAEFGKLPSQVLVVSKSEEES